MHTSSAVTKAGLSQDVLIPKICPRLLDKMTHHLWPKEPWPKKGHKQKIQQNFWNDGCKNHSFCWWLLSEWSLNDHKFPSFSHESLQKSWKHCKITWEIDIYIYIYILYYISIYIYIYLRRNPCQIPCCQYWPCHPSCWSEGPPLWRRLAWYPPLKFNMKPENQLLEQEIPVGNHNFQVPCWTLGGSMLIFWGSMLFFWGPMLNLGGGNIKESSAFVWSKNFYFRIRIIHHLQLMRFLNTTGLQTNRRNCA